MRSENARCQFPDARDEQNGKLKIKCEMRNAK